MEPINKQNHLLLVNSGFISCKLFFKNNCGLMNKYLLLFTLCFVSNFINAQDNNLYMPFEYQRAYRNNTRSLDGKPGKNYWVNKASYKIEAEINPDTKILTGIAKINYENHSPDSLRGLVLRLYQDMYKKGTVRDRSINPDDVTDGVEISKVTVSEQKIELENSSMASRFGTNLVIRLPEMLAPENDVTLTISWSLKIPEKTLIRMGSIDKSSMFVGYWYPQISVYDDIEGWDFLNYSNRQEFYTDNALFDVQLTVPSDYYVWATGELQNPKKIYNGSTLKKLEEARKSNKTVQIIDGSENGLLSKKGEITWEFAAKNVPDFAFALSNHYLWDASSVLIDSTGTERVLINTVYNKNTKEAFQYVTEYQRQSMLYFSNVLPGIKYPYPQFTTFQGLDGGGMEFPMMANNGESSHRNKDKARYSNLDLTAHEMAHTYFPFLTGINERKYTWMEEGWATLFGDFAAQYISKDVGIKTDEEMFSTYANRFLRTEGSFYSVPLMTPSILIREAWPHFHAAYYKPYFAYRILHDILGKETFGKCLREYINRWEGKHPTPYDFFFTFNDVSGENLNWFWKPWFFEFGYPDLGIKSVKENNIVIEKVGALPFPIELKVIYDDNSFEILKYTARVWKDNPYEFEITTEKSVSSVEILFNNYPDVNAENDVKRK